MPKKEIVVVGSSAGGIEALRTLVGSLPAEFRGSLFIVQHLSPSSPSLLADILDRATKLPVRDARDGEEFQPGYVYVAPPDQHLLLEPGGHVRLTRGPKENRFRPAVDPLFRSAARVYGPRVIGCILSGSLDDGTMGLLEVKRRGGTAVVQAPADALVPSMPLSAMRHVKVDYVLPVAEIGPLLVELAGQASSEEGAYAVSENLEIEVKIAGEDRATKVGVTRLGEASPFACPECHGVLLRIREDGPTRFRCHTGHAHTAQSLLTEMTETAEDTLWSAIRSLEEGAMLMRHVAAHAREAGDETEAQALLGKAEDSQRRANLVRQAVMNHEKVSAESASRS